MRAIDTTATDFATFFDGVPGEDRVLIRWEAMLSYFRTLEETCDRLKVESIGTSTEGREMVLLIIAAPETLREIEHARTLRQHLSAAHLLRDPALADGTIAGGKTVVLVTSAIHATEIGSAQLCPELVHRLVTRDDDETRQMLDNVIVLLVPTLNPDGMDLVHDWYERTLGTAAEGTMPPALYHRFAGHDNNRDWIHHALAETRNTVRNVHRLWKPHVVLDLHQMQATGARFFIPPYIDPVEENVPCSIVAAGNAIGSHIATRMVNNGLAGTVSGVLFDAFSPSRAYSHYHGGVRILAEAASARIATPYELGEDDFVVSRGFDPRIKSVHNPLPWKAGTWRLRDIMDYHREAVLGTVEHAANFRETWLRWQWQALAETIGAPTSRTFAIPPLEHQNDPAAARELILMMDEAEIGIEALTESVPHANAHLPRGTFLISTAQPFGGWPAALLPPTVYPNPDPSSRPYDTTTHSLVVHMGVEAMSVERLDSWKSQPVTRSALERLGTLESPRVGHGRWMALDPRGHEAVHVATLALQRGARVYRLARSHFSEGHLLEPGTWLVAGEDTSEFLDLASRLAVRARTLLPVADGLLIQRQPRIGLHLAAWQNATDAGWTRLILESHAIPHQLLSDRHVRADDLAERFDVILLPHATAVQLVSGHKTDEYPDDVAGGIGEQGFAALKRFVEAGGHLIAIDGAAQATIEQLELPVELPLGKLTDAEFFAPGAAIRTMVETSHPLGWGLGEVIPALQSGKNALRATDGSGATTPLRFASEQIVASGWVHGEEQLAGLHAVVDLPHGSGLITLIAIRPQFRAQTHVSFNLLFNALYRAGLQQP